LQQWFNDAKRDLIDSGLVIDQEVRDRNGNLLSELDFGSDEVQRRIINMDETNHDLSVTGDRGGPRCVMYHNPILPSNMAAGEVSSHWHVTGVYAKILKAWAKIGFVPCSWKCLLRQEGSA
jgi:hypothetical protein